MTTSADGSGMPVVDGAPFVALTALYVPADRGDRIEKALAAGADIVIVDLEDAVAPSRKDAARAALATLGMGLPGSVGSVGAAVQVRINARGSRWHEADLAAVGALPADVGVRVPKVESAEDIRAVADAVPGHAIHALVESALGVERAFEIASAGIASAGIASAGVESVGVASAGVASVALGEADLRSQLGLAPGMAGEPGLRWARSRLVNAAAAAGLPAPMMSVYADIRDAIGLAASCATGRALGLVGRAAIHPSQLPVIVAAFAPSAAEVARAREVLARVGAARADGVGTVVLDDGTFLDVAMVRAARRTLALADRSR